MARILKWLIAPAVVMVGLLLAGPSQAKADWVYYGGPVGGVHVQYRTVIPTPVVRVYRPAPVIIYGRPRVIQVWGYGYPGVVCW